MAKKPFYEIEKCFSKKQKPSKECIDFFHQALIIDMNKRKSAKQLMSHKWIRMHNENPKEGLVTEQDKAKIYNNVVHYADSTPFVKMIASLAIGLGMDD